MLLRLGEQKLIHAGGFPILQHVVPRDVANRQAAVAVERVVQLVGGVVRGDVHGQAHAGLGLLTHVQEGLFLAGLAPLLILPLLLEASVAAVQVHHAEGLVRIAVEESLAGDAHHLRDMRGRFEVDLRVQARALLEDERAEARPPRSGCELLDHLLVAGDDGVGVALDLATAWDGVLDAVAHTLALSGDAQAGTARVDDALPVRVGHGAPILLRVVHEILEAHLGVEVGGDERADSELHASVLGHLFVALQVLELHGERLVVEQRVQRGSVVHGETRGRERGAERTGHPAVRDAGDRGDGNHHTEAGATRCAPGLIVPLLAVEEGDTRVLVGHRGGGARARVGLCPTPVNTLDGENAKAVTEKLLGWDRMI